MITVYYRGALSRLTGKASEEIEADTVRDVLAFVHTCYGKEAYAAARRMLITVNNDSILLHAGMKTRLTQGNCVSFLPVAGGG